MKSSFMMDIIVIRSLKKIVFQNFPGKLLEWERGLGIPSDNLGVKRALDWVDFFSWPWDNDRNYNHMEEISIL